LDETGEDESVDVGSESHRNEENHAKDPIRSLSALLGIWLLPYLHDESTDDELRTTTESLRDGSKDERSWKR
jgi:hypothetical protein